MICIFCFKSADDPTPWVPAILAEAARMGWRTSTRLSRQRRSQRRSRTGNYACGAGCTLRTRRRRPTAAPTGIRRDPRLAPGHDVVLAHMRSPMPSTGTAGSRMSRQWSTTSREVVPKCVRPLDSSCVAAVVKYVQFIEPNGDNKCNAQQVSGAQVADTVGRTAKTSEWSGGAAH